MNFSFKLGKVVIPVAEEVNIHIEGIEVAVSDYNLREGLEVVKAIPGIMKQMKDVMEGAPAAEEDEDESVLESILSGKGLGGFKVEKVNPSAPDLEELLKGMGAKKVNHPIFGEGMAVPKDNPLLKAFLKEEAQAELPKGLKDILGGKVPHPLEALFGGQGENEKAEHPLSGLLNQIKKDLEDKLNK